MAIFRGGAISIDGLDIDGTLGVSRDITRSNAKPQSILALDQVDGVFNPNPPGVGEDVGGTRGCIDHYRGGNGRTLPMDLTNGWDLANGPYQWIY